MKFRSLYFIMLNEGIASRALFILGHGLRNFLHFLLLKELDFGLQKPTGPSSGVVASILLVSPGVSLAEVCATCLRCHLW